MSGIKKTREKGFKSRGKREKGEKAKRGKI
jgi:hypothetical protein